MSARSDGTGNSPLASGVPTLAASTSRVTGGDTYSSIYRMLTRSLFTLYGLKRRTCHHLSPLGLHCGPCLSLNFRYRRTDQGDVVVDILQVCYRGHLD